MKRRKVSAREIRSRVCGRGAKNVRSRKSQNVEMLAKKKKINTTIGKKF